MFRIINARFAFFGVSMLFVGLRAGVFGRKEVDADFIVHDLFCDYAMKRRLGVYVYEDENGQEAKVWDYVYDYIKTYRPPQLKGLEGGAKWRSPKPFPSHAPN